MGQAFQKIGDQYEKDEDVNYVRANWKNGFWYGYDAAVQALEGIGRGLAIWLDKKLGTDPILFRNMTIIGHSLGAHIAGCIGRKTRHRVGTIIGLDPASKLPSIRKS
jgi:pimeloyl-ACP methyl ester carboxylesterase